MAVSYGFYNALEHDRLYDAIQMSSIFDGIIRDGVFSTIGTALNVVASEDGMYVNVGPGRAWFNHTWTYNDTIYPIEAEEAEVVLDRIDAVVLEVNAGPEVRANSIKFVKGTPSSNPVKPTMIHNAEVNQYALAYVRIRAGQTTIFQSDIENAVGTDETPFVTGLLQQVSVEQLLLQWNDDFYRYFANFQRTSTAEFTTWLLAKKDEYDNWYAAMEAEGAHDLETFDTWFQHMKDQLDEDAAGHLQQEIDELAEACEKGSVFTVSTEEPELVGRSCVISQGVESVTKQFDANGVAAFPSMPYIGTIHVEATDGDNVAQGEMTVPYFGRYGMQIAFWAATLNISTSADGLIGRPITITKGGVVVGTTSFNASGRATYKVHEAGTYIVSSSTAGGDEYAATVVVTEETAYPVNLGIPSGATATPTDDIQTWLKCASIYDKSYTLLDDVLEDYYTCERLFSDSNACDYMARSTSWAAIVCTDASVMEQIGKYDYCCNKLIGNATWAEAIANSAYWESVLRSLVPVMTDNTHPSGTVSYISQLSGCEGYRAFNGITNVGWLASSGYFKLNDWLAYKFDAPEVVARAVVGYSFTSSSTVYFKVQGSDDNFVSDIHDLCTEQIISGSSQYNSVSIPLNSIDDYQSYRIIATRNISVAAGNGFTVQFYGRHEAQTDLIHSAANDTVYYYDSNNVERQLCVTDANGNGTVDWSEMEPGIYTFYSTVAKNPDNLSEEYSRTVKITKTTTEVYLMPVNSLYWNGFRSADLKAGVSTDDPIRTGYNAANLIAPVFNANNINMTSQSNKSSYIYSTAIDLCKVLKAIATGYNYGYLRAVDIVPYDASSVSGHNILKQLLTTKSLFTIDTTDYNKGVLVNANEGSSYAIVDALWRITQRELTVFSAANDTVYYIDENDRHITFAKTDETGAASVDLGLIPQGTYTLYSTIAKDPDNLSNPYSKQITIGPDTKTVKVMPDGAVYWYGWRSFDDTNSVTFSSESYTYGGRTINSDDFQTNKMNVRINLSRTSYSACAFATSNPVLLAGHTLHTIGGRSDYNSGNPVHQSELNETSQDLYIGAESTYAYNGSYYTIRIDGLNVVSGSATRPVMLSLAPSDNPSVTSAYIDAIWVAHD